MRLFGSILLLLAGSTLASCATTGGPSNKALATATLLDADGAVVGNATILASGQHLTLRLDGQRLSEGVHGAHLHAVGRCAPRDFSSAGGHLNPTGRMHGHLNPQGSHMGDLPNLVIGADGKGGISAELPGTREGLEPTLFDADGTAIVIHANADDYRTDPSGNSGGRIACGVFAQVR